MNLKIIASMMTIMSLSNYLFSNSNEDFNKDTIPHFFIYLKSEKSPYIIDFGNYKITKSKIKVDERFNDLTEFKKAISKTSAKKNEKWLIYIHGLWANQKTFEETTGKILQDEIFNNLKEYDKIISLKWTSAVDYKKNLIITEEKGKEFAKLLAEIIDKKECNIELNFLLHSMGNRVFKSLSQELIKQDKKINNILMVAADIENNVLVNELKDLPEMCNKIYAFYNIDDRTLNVANSLKSYNRLGISGPCDETKKLNNFISINTTGLKDNEGITPKMTLHRYYYSSPSIRKLITNILNGEVEGELLGKKLKL